jgi:hypothetical protein
LGATATPETDAEFWAKELVLVPISTVTTNAHNLEQILIAVYALFHRALNLASA